MARHDTPRAGFRSLPAGLVALTPVHPAPAPAPARMTTLRPSFGGVTAVRSEHAASTRLLVAAVAVGAAMPALQSLPTHVADAESTTTEIGRAGLALAAEGSAPVRAAVEGVTTVTMPRVVAGAVSAASAVGVPDVAAGDAGDVASLTKAIGVTRENGPVRFGTPYQAGDEKTLDGQIAKALGLMGLPQKLAPGVKQIIMRESTGNADAINNWDSNAAAGTPSKGLMQLIDPTFRSAVLPSLADRGIYDPVANITAGVRTMIANHGLDAVLDGGLRNSAGNYVGYGGSKLPTDGLGLAARG